MNQVVKW